MENRQWYVELCVGLFILLGIGAVFVLVMQISGVLPFSGRAGYHVTAEFSDIGGLKVRAPVTLAGVKIGEVTRIELQPREFNARVTMRLHADKSIPYEDTTARILTEGLIGSNYVSIVPGFEEESAQEHPYLKEGDKIAKTQEAMILENLIGQFLFNINKK
ncbi:MAG: outer membrane lipid asymmetry maintenance protein MlaD [Legionella sp.]|nr:outer membrane lipid asymmetry maintenance protein MlaD [Legionella sp.]